MLLVSWRFFERFSYRGAYRLKVFQDVRIREPYYANAAGLQCRGSQLVIALRTVGVMTIAVELDGQPLARAVEVGDVLAERFLPGELLRKIAQELKPQFLFRRRRIAAQSLGARSKVGAVSDPSGPAICA